MEKKRNYCQTIMDGFLDSISSKARSRPWCKVRIPLSVVFLYLYLMMYAFAAVARPHSASWCGAGLLRWSPLHLLSSPWRPCGETWSVETRGRASGGGYICTFAHRHIASSLLIKGVPHGSTLDPQLFGLFMSAQEVIIYKQVQFWLNVELRGVLHSQITGSLRLVDLIPELSVYRKWLSFKLARSSWQFMLQT